MRNRDDGESAPGTVEKQDKVDTEITSSKLKKLDETTGEFITRSDKEHET